MKNPGDLTKREATAWVALEIAACPTPALRFRRAQVERELMRRYAELRLDKALPVATQAQRDLIAALEAADVAEMAAYLE